MANASAHLHQAAPHSPPDWTFSTPSRLSPEARLPSLMTHAASACRAHVETTYPRLSRAGLKKSWVTRGLATDDRTVQPCTTRATTTYNHASLLHTTEIHTSCCLAHNLTVCWVDPSFPNLCIHQMDLNAGMDPHFPPHILEDADSVVCNGPMR